MAILELAHLLQIPRGHADRAMLELVDRGIVRGHSGQLTFKNQLHRDFVYYAISEDSRRYYHSILAQNRVESGGPDDFQLGLEACHHFVRAAMVERAIEILPAAARLAISRGAAREAERATTAVRSALGDSPCSALHLLVAQAQAAQGKYHAALETLQEWRSDQHNPSEEVSALLLRAESLQRGGLTDPPTIAAAAQEAYTAAHEAGSPFQLMSALQLAAEVAAELGSLEDLERLSTQAHRIGESSDSNRTRALGQLTRGYYYLVNAEWRESADNFRGFLDLSAGESPGPAQMQVLNGLGMASEALGRFDDAEVAYLKAAEISHRIGNAHGGISVWNNLAVLYDAWGDFIRSCEAYRRALDLAQETPTPRRLVTLYANVSELSVSLGNLPEARKFLDRAFATATEAGHTPLIARTLLSDAGYHLARRDHDAAWRAFEEADHLHYGQRHVMDHPGQYWMIWIYRSWVRHEYSKVTRMLEEPPPSLRRGTLAHRTVIQLLATSLAARSAALGPVLSDELRIPQADWLPGSVATVLAVGISPPGVPSPRPGESAAQLVARTYPHLVRTPVPDSVVGK